VTSLTSVETNRSRGPGTNSDSQHGKESANLWASEPWLPASRYLTWTQNRCSSDVTHATDVVYDVA